MTDTSRTGPVSGAARLSRLGVVVHPARDISSPFGALRTWASERDCELVELDGAGEPRTGLPPGQAGECDLVVAIGGDGTALGAMRSAAAAGRLVLGVACGSLGALTTVAGDGVVEALDRLQAGDYGSRPVAALVIAPDDGPELVAFNDMAFVRRGDGQVRVEAFLDGALYVRLAGDGCIVSTSQGSSAYTIAAGGPLIDPALDAVVFTPLPSHGGCAPPLVLSPDSELELRLTVGHGGARLEIDGHGSATEAERLIVTLRPHAAAVVSFADSASHLTGLRERGIIADSPRIISDDRRRR